MKYNEQTMNQIFNGMLWGEEKNLCPIYCVFKLKNWGNLSGDMLMGYATCTSGGWLLIVMYSPLEQVFNEDPTQTYATYEIALAKSLKIRKTIFGQYIIKMVFPAEKKDIKIRLQAAPKVFGYNFPNQKRNLEKMVEILNNIREDK
ncbi:MAG: hypothetical protein K2K96_13890 [Lachnospiraceae bacterium]|nr:hypothetical protein [Lachnospiraceae bacterium]